MVEAIVALVSEAKHGLPGTLAAIGVGAPGTIDRATGVVARSPNLAGWVKPFALGATLGQRLGVPVVVDNDVRAALLGEHRLGSGSRFHDLLGVWFGTGVGGGLILDNQLRRGSAGACGEIGHVVVKRRGRRCGCGRRGCFEAYAGRASMERRAKKLMDKGRRTDVFKIMAQQGKDHLTSGVLAKALLAGDRLTAELLDQAVEAAGVAVASAVTLLDVQAVIIGGGVGSRLGAPFAERIAAAMQTHLFVDGKSRVQVLTAGLGDLGGALGAASEAAELAAAT
ncbi:MAG: hypothetical protein NVSMB29_17850 [Candidatus Dormibacteria bacterium]